MPASGPVFVLYFGLIFLVDYDGYSSVAMNELPCLDVCLFFTV